MSIVKQYATTTPAQSAETLHAGCEDMCGPGCRHDPAVILANLLAFRAANPVDPPPSEACDEPAEPDYCQHSSARCACDRAADLYYGDL